MSVENEIKKQLALEGITEEATEEVTGEVQEEKQFTEFEQEQMKKGWKPGGEKSAEEFARAEPLYNELKSRGKEIKDLRRTVDEMAALMQKQSEIAYQQAYKDLEAQRAQAIQNGDIALVNTLEKEQQQLEQPKITSLPPPTAVVEFTDKYRVVLEAANYEAAKIGDWVRKRDAELYEQKLDPDTHMQLLEEQMLETFPSYFGKQSNTTTAVESGTGSNVAGNTKKRMPTFNDLTSEQKQAARDFVAYGAFKSTDDYIKKLVELGEIK